MLSHNFKRIEVPEPHEISGRSDCLLKLWSQPRYAKNWRPAFSYESVTFFFCHVSLPVNLNGSSVAEAFETALARSKMTLPLDEVLKGSSGGYARAGEDVEKDIEIVSKED